MTIKEHVGLRIHLYRKKQNLTLEQLAFLLDKSISTVSKYETGKISIDIETLYDISKILHVSIEQLIDYHVDEKERRRSSLRPDFSRKRRNTGCINISRR